MPHHPNHKVGFRSVLSRNDRTFFGDAVDFGSTSAVCYPTFASHLSIRSPPFGPIFQSALLLRSSPAFPKDIGLSTSIDLLSDTDRFCRSLPRFIRSDLMRERVCAPSARSSELSARTPLKHVAFVCQPKRMNCACPVLHSFCCLRSACSNSAFRFGFFKVHFSVATYLIACLLKRFTRGHFCFSSQKACTVGVCL